MRLLSITLSRIGVIKNCFGIDRTGKRFAKLATIAISNDWKNQELSQGAMLMDCRSMAIITGTTDRGAVEIFPTLKTIDRSLPSFAETAKFIGGVLIIVSY
jgi:hypothetical protein